MRNEGDGTIEHSVSSASATDDATAIGRDQINITNIFPAPAPRQRPPTIYNAPTPDVVRIARAHRRALWWAKVRLVFSLPVLTFIGYVVYAFASVLPNNLPGLLTTTTAPQNLWGMVAVQSVLAIWLWFHARRFRARIESARGALRICERVLQQRVDHVH